MVLALRILPFGGRWWWCGHHPQVASPAGLPGLSNGDELLALSSGRKARFDAFSIQLFRRFGSAN